MEQHSAAYNDTAFDATSYELVDTQGPRVGDAMPDFALSTMDGEPVRLSDFRGKIMVLETGSITCPIDLSTSTPAPSPVKNFISLAKRLVIHGDRKPTKCAPAAGCPHCFSPAA